MGYNSSIRGSIEGISKDSFELIKEDLEYVFDIVYLENGKLYLEGNGKHYDANMFPAYDKIAFCIDGTCGGCLEEEGDEWLDYSFIFFCHRQWEKLWVEVNYPENPFDRSKTYAQ